MAKNENKFMTMTEAVRKFVPSGCSLALGNFLTCGSYGIVHEILRQHVTDLTVYSTSTVGELDLLVGGGCVKRVATAYSHRFGTTHNGSAVERAIRKKQIEYEDYSNYSIAAMFQAGAMGLSFMPILPAIGTTDIFNKRTWMGEDKMKWMDCPFTGKKWIVVPAINPDVTIIHAQRADTEGNVQYWGTMSVVRDFAMAAKHVIVSVEEIVPKEIVTLSPHNTILPGFRVDAIVECPWGGHPQELLGFYGLDYPFEAQYFLDAQSQHQYKRWLEEWVYSVRDRSEYLEKYIELNGQDALDKLRARHLYSAPVDYGSPQKGYWEDGFNSRVLGMNKDEFIKFLDEHLEMYDKED
jgi:glutaconate CoA-transferase subunit A